MAMAAEGALCGFIYVEGSAQSAPEDAEPLAPSTLGIADGPGKWESGARGWDGLRAGQDLAPPLSGPAPQR